MANQIELCDLSYSARHVAIHTYINQMMMIQLFWWSIIISTYCYGFEPWNSLIVGERYTSSWYFMNGKKKLTIKIVMAKSSVRLQYSIIDFFYATSKQGKITRDRNLWPINLSPVIGFDWRESIETESVFDLFVLFSLQFAASLVTQIKFRVDNSNLYDAHSVYLWCLFSTFVRRKFEKLNHNAGNEVTRIVKGNTNNNNTINTRIKRGRQVNCWEMLKIF